MFKSLVRYPFSANEIEEIKNLTHRSLDSVHSVRLGFNSILSEFLE